MQRAQVLLRSLSKEFRVILVFFALYTWNISLILPYADLFAVALGVSPALLGLLVGIGQVAGSLTSLLFGWYADFYGVKKALVDSLVICLVAFLLYSLAINWWMIVPSIILLGIARMTVLPLVDIKLIGTLEKQYRAKVIGFVRARAR